MFHVQLIGGKAGGIWGPGPVLRQPNHQKRWTKEGVSLTHAAKPKTPTCSLTTQLVATAEVL